MALASVEPPDNAWGTVRLWIVALERLGYHTEEHRILGRSVLYLS